MARTHGSRLNLLGVISILLALAALVATRMPIAGYGPTPIAVLGIGMGVIGFLIALLIGRWGSGTPVLGIALSLGAIGWVRYSDGTLPAWWAKIHPVPPSAPVAAPTLATPPSVTPDVPHEHNIFTDPGSSTATDIPSRAAPHATPVTSTPDIPPANTPPMPTALSVADARAKLDAAIAAVEKSLASDPAYAAAKTAVDAADAKRKSALSASGPGSADVLAASNEWINARTQLKKLVDAAAAKDPAVESAQRDLKDAEASARSSKSPAH